MTRIFQTKVEAGQRMVATDITDLTFFPAGAILMMDGSWQDGRGGWYICDGRRTPHGYTPDLSDKFIMGNSKIGAPQNHDNNFVTLEIKHIPKHKHDITDKQHSHGVALHTAIGASGYHGDALLRPSKQQTEMAFTGITETGYVGNGEAFDNRPSYYSVIYIKKMV
jgi:hypothetical protein